MDYKDILLISTTVSFVVAIISKIIDFVLEKKLNNRTAIELKYVKEMLEDKIKSIEEDIKEIYSKIEKIYDKIDKKE